MPDVELPKSRTAPCGGQTRQAALTWMRGTGVKSVWLTHKARDKLLYLREMYRGDRAN
jgi:hypothetical protein